MVLRYLVDAPPAARPLPVLCFLHGYGEAAPLPLGRALRRHRPLASGAAALARREFIIVAPQLPVAGGLWVQHADGVRALTDQICAMHPVDASRLYLTGFSFGGNGVFDLGALQPGLWAALWAVDPARVPQQAPLQPLWLSAGELARAQRRAFVSALGLPP